MKLANKKIRAYPQQASRSSHRTKCMNHVEKLQTPLGKVILGSFDVDYLDEYFLDVLEPIFKQGMIGLNASSPETIFGLTVERWSH